MLVKALELSIVLIVISYIFLNFIQISENLYIFYREKYQFLERFLVGRFLIKFLTESETLSYTTCNLNENFSYLINGNLNITDIIKNAELLNNVKIEIEDLENKEKVFELGNIKKDFVSFSRVCNYNGKLIKINVLV
ncbi:MAG: hypothetical protein QXP34_02840 [Candidatus Aenigmatarchaeota archaeon]